MGDTRADIYYAKGKRRILIVDDELINDETLNELAEALIALPAQLREIIVLRYYDGMPLTEIGKKLSLSYGAIKLRHAKALELLRQGMDRS